MAGNETANETAYGLAKALEPYLGVSLANDIVSADPLVVSVMILGFSLIVATIVLFIMKVVQALIDRGPLPGSPEPRD
jgi:hypothetical protein